MMLAGRFGNFLRQRFIVDALIFLLRNRRTSERRIKKYFYVAIRQNCALILLEITIFLSESTYTREEYGEFFIIQVSWRGAACP